MIRNNNIFSKFLLLLLLVLGWGSSAWAQNVTQLPLQSGVYEILNISNESGSGTGRGYLVSFTQHSSGIGLADCTYASYRSRHPLNPNDGSTTCSYWYLHNHGDGTYTLVSISDLGGNTVPRFLTVGTTTGKSSIATTPETRLVFTDTNTANHNRNGKKAVNIANQSASNVYLSGGCGTYSTSGSIMATTNSGDGGCPWLFMPVEETSLSEGQKAIRAKYLERFVYLPDGTKMVYQDTEGHPITSSSKLVKYTPAGGGYTVEFSSSDVTYDFHNVLFNPSAFCGTFDYSLKQVAFNKATSTLTFTLAINKWYKMKVANISAYVSTDYADANGMRLTSGQDDPDTYAGVWRSVDAGGEALNSNGQNVCLYNAKFYDSKLLAMTNPANDGNARGSMYALNAVPSGAATVYEQRINPSQTNSYYFRITGTGVNTNTYINQRNPYFSNWTNGGYGGSGSQFIIEEVPNLGTEVSISIKDAGGQVLSDAKILYTSQRVDISSVKEQLGNGQVYNFGNVPYVRSLFSDTPTTHIISVDYDEENALLTFTVKKTPSSEWTIVIKGGDDYVVDYQSLLQAKNGEALILPLVLKAIDFKINAPADKFVWGPVIDTHAKTVTYDVRERAAELATGWYQLQLAKGQSDITAIANRIKQDEGNVNTSANTLYLAPATLEPGNSRYFKITGVPDYAGEASTYVFIRKDGENAYTLTNASTGTSISGTNFTFNGGLLTMSSGWSLEDGTNNNLVHPLEGPYVKPTGSYAFAFNVAAVDMSQLKVYQIITNTNDATVQISINNSDILGSTVVKHGGYIFLPNDANAPAQSQFRVHSGNAVIRNVVIGDEADGVTPITVSLETRRTLWKAIITGDAKSDADRVVYNDMSFANNDNMSLPFGSTPSPVDFKTNITDRFVWGPIINNNLKTVTFEVRETATSLTAGKWYQMVLYDKKPGQVFNGGVQNVTSMVEGVNSLGTLRQKSNYIYPITASSLAWTVELTGTTGADMEAQTYIYISKASASSVTMMMQNGRYVNNNGQGTTNSNENLALVYQDATKTFKWNTNAIPWNNLDNTGKVGIGNTGSASNGNMEFFMTQVSVNAYKVVLSNGSGTLVYNGDAEIIGSKRAANGYFIFAKADQSLETDIAKYDLRGVDGTITGITTSTTGGYTTLTVTVEARSYDHEIIHKQNRYYDYLETDANKPDDGFIQDGEGWNTRLAKDGITTIREQNTSLFEIPVYLKQGTSITSYLPTNQLASYQRWYNWDTDGQVDRTVLTNTNFGSFTEFKNGYAIFRGAQNGDNQAYVPVLTLPSTMTEYNVGLDISRFTDYTQNVANTNSSAIEPTLGMRVVYKVRDAKQIANAIKDSTSKNVFFETHNIALPNVQYGSRDKRLEDRTLSTTLPLDMDLNNYWGFNNGGTGNDNLVQLTQDSQLRIELVDGGSNIQNYMMIPGSASDASGKISRTSFNTGHFVLFQYPDNGYIEPNATATINVYMKSGTVEYKLVQFNLTFIGNAHPLVVTELKDSYRHPDALAEQFGAPVTELTFDEGQNSEYSTSDNGVNYPDYRYPLDYKGASYAFGARNEGRGWAASRGEYALQSYAGSSQQTGTPRLAYYPVTNYLRSMKDPSSAFGPKEAGAYQLYIDAADQPGKIASIELKDALCAGSRLYCYGYIGCTSGGTGQHPTSVLINVMGINKTTGKEELIYSYCPGIITLRGYAEDGRTIYSTSLGSSSSYSTRDGAEDRNYWAPWQQIGFSFAIDAATASKMVGYTIQIMNNAYNSNGGDTMLDDFQIYVKKPGAEVANTTPLCSDQIRHIKVITEYQTLLEATGEDTNHDGLMNVGFCFLDKEVYDKTLAEHADQDAEHGYPRNSPNNKYNIAFGEALMGKRTLDKKNKDHAFHNFDIIRDGQESTIDGVTKVRYYDKDIPQYSFKESSDDVVYRDSIRGERYIVFKESVAHGEPSGITQHKWTAGKSYYLLFSTATISEEHVDNHDLGCTVFNLDDNKCSVLYEFTVAPPVTIKGDAETITSGDEVQACFGQTTTLSVNLNGRTDTKDVIIKNLNYDWWMGYVSHKTMEMENGVPKYYDENGHAIIDTSKPDVEYNTLPATLQNYMNVWWGTYKQDNVHLGKKAGDKIFLSDALLEFRRAYPNAVNLVGVVPVHKIGDTVEYELTQDMIDCVAHFLVTEPESGNTPLILMKKEANLTLGIDKADKDHIVHFVVIPIAPSIYSVDEDAIYCPDPQELKIKLMDEGPSLANGFDNMTYPDAMDNVPMRVGLQQINNVRHRADASKQRTLTVPLRKAKFAYPEIGQRFIKTLEPDVLLVGTNDPAYKQLNGNIEDSHPGSFTPNEEDTEEMFISVGRVEAMNVEKDAGNPTMQLVFNGSTVFREGYTYTLKVKYYEVYDNEGVDVRDMACEGSFVFDMKVVPEYQVWTGATGNSEWTNDQNWARADRNELLAGNGTATGDGMVGATSLNDETSYESNEKNTTNISFVPMYFTNVLFNRPDSIASELYKESDFKRPVKGTNFLEGLKNTSTSFIVYDMEVTPVNVANRTSFNYDCDYTCELFDTYIANGVTFEPKTQLGNAQHLDYNKAWVEYELDAGRWYTLASPLKASVAGDWYSPTKGGRQLTPHFYDINFKGEGPDKLNDRFRPAYYQRSWDRAGNNIVYEKDNSTYNSYVRADWSFVYNDATVDYSNGGFSVKPELEHMAPVDRPTDSKVLVRLPKADESYTYYDIKGSTGQAPDAQIGNRTESYHLLSDNLKTAPSFTMSIENKTAGNNFFLVSNPFMTAMDMDAFFTANPELEAKYWIVSSDKQEVSVRSTDGQWITTGEVEGKYVAPLQGFFVKAKNASQTSLNASYTAVMQTVVNPDPTHNNGVPLLRAPGRTRAAESQNDVIRLTAERNGASSTALIILQEGANDNYVAGEDCETFIDGNLYAHPTVFTSAGAMAQSINVRKAIDMVPVGMISSDDSEATLRFDLSASSDDMLYLYDSVEDTYTKIYDGTEVPMNGNTVGRYFLCKEPIETSLNPEEMDGIKQGVWTVGGAYLGKSVKNLRPGIYIVDGVKMIIR